MIMSFCLGVLISWEIYTPGSTYFPKESLFPRIRVLPGVSISWEIYTGEYLFPGSKHWGVFFRGVLIFCDTGPKWYYFFTGEGRVKGI